MHPVALWWFDVSIGPEMRGLLIGGVLAIAGSVVAQLFIG
jgi:hypothetical protein